MWPELGWKFWVRGNSSGWGFRRGLAEPRGVLRTPRGFENTAGFCKTPRGFENTAGFCKTPRGFENTAVFWRSFEFHGVLEDSSVEFSKFLTLVSSWYWGNASCLEFEPDSCKKASYLYCMDALFELDNQKEWSPIRPRFFFLLLMLKQNTEGKVKLLTCEWHTAPWAAHRILLEC